MKKSILPSIVAALAACAALTCAARVNVVHKTDIPDHDKREGLTHEKFSGKFDNCSIWLDYTLEGGRSVSRRWGDFFFGSSLGWGRWSPWWFLSVFQQGEKGDVNLLFKTRPEVFFGYSAEGADFIVAEWAAGDGKRLRLRFASYPSHRDWLFAKVEFDGVDVKRVSLDAHPGHIVAPKGRELHLTTKERDWSLAEKGAEFAASSPLILLTPRYSNERTGSKIVYDVAPVKTVSVPRCGGGIPVSFVPKKGAKSMTFAFGFFKDKDPDDQRVRFIGEEGDIIHGFLRGVDWEAAPSDVEFKESVGIALRLGVRSAELKPVVDRFKAARKACDVATVSECEAQVREMRSKAVAEGLRAFEKGKKK